MIRQHTGARPYHASARHRLILFAPVVALVLFVFTAIPSSSADVSKDYASAHSDYSIDARRLALATKFAPIVLTKVLPNQCQTMVTNYFPTEVDWLFKQQEGVVLRINDQVIMPNPTVSDLSSGDDKAYLDFIPEPGSDSRCSYARYFDRAVSREDLQPTAYVQFITDNNHVFVFYWLYYFYNDWNNTHESDWEFIALAFPVSDETALFAGETIEPSFVAYSQHEGGERRDWQSDDLLKDGSHPKVFAAAGSHANYFNANTMIGWSKDAGIGCDETTGPHSVLPTIGSPRDIRSPVNVIVLPDQPLGETAWVNYLGRWGAITNSNLKSQWLYDVFPSDLVTAIEKIDGSMSGPYGPSRERKGVLRQPSATFQSWKTGVLIEPPSFVPVTNVTDQFCWIAKYGAAAIGKVTSRLAFALIIFLVSVFLLTINGVRIFLRAGTTIIRFPKTFLLVNAVTVSLFVGLALIVSQVVQWTRSIAPNQTAAFAHALPGGESARAAYQLLLLEAAMLLIVAPPVIVAMRDLRNGTRPTVNDSFRGSLFYLKAMLPSIIALSGIVILTVIGWLGWVVAFCVFVALQFFTQAIVFDSARGLLTPLRQSFARSVSITRYPRIVWHSLALQVFALLPGLVIGVLSIVHFEVGAREANALTIVLYVVLVPWWVVYISHLYLDLGRETTD